VVLAEASLSNGIAGKGTVILYPGTLYTILVYLSVLRTSKLVKAIREVDADTPVHDQQTMYLSIIGTATDKPVPDD